jgi:hypothetical protein
LRKVAGQLLRAVGQYENVRRRLPTPSKTLALANEITEEDARSVSGVPVVTLPPEKVNRQFRIVYCVATAKPQHTNF